MYFCIRLKLYLNSYKRYPVKAHQVIRNVFGTASSHKNETVTQKNYVNKNICVYNITCIHIFKTIIRYDV